MAVRQQRICDLCGSDEGTDTLTVVWHYYEGNPWEIDLCERCYQNRIADLAPKGRKATINNIRPQHRMRKTVISKDAL